MAVGYRSGEVDPRAGDRVTPWPQAPLDVWERVVSLIVGGTALANGVAIWRDSEE